LTKSCKKLNELQQIDTTSFSSQKEGTKDIELFPTASFSSRKKEVQPYIPPHRRGNSICPTFPLPAVMKLDKIMEKGNRTQHSKMTRQLRQKTRKQSARHHGKNAVTPHDTMQDCIPLASSLVADRKKQSMPIKTTETGTSEKAKEQKGTKCVKSSFSFQSVSPETEQSKQDPFIRRKHPSCTHLLPFPSRMVPISPHAIRSIPSPETMMVHDDNYSLFRFDFVHTHALFRQIG
jgi:hypothetical protein